MRCNMRNMLDMLLNEAISTTKTKYSECKAILFTFNPSQLSVRYALSCEWRSVKDYM